MEYRNSVVVGVTGGIGCGQTTVSRLFESFGAKVIQADLVAHEVLRRDRNVKRELRKAFGDSIFFGNGRLNRQALAAIAFQDESKTQRLNRIVHPRMVAEIIEQIEKARESGRYQVIVVDAALIYELNLEHMFDAVVVVGARMGKRIQRIKKRDGISSREISDRIQKQIPIEDKMKWGDFVIENNGTLKELEAQARKVYESLKKMAQRKRRRARA